MLIHGLAVDAVASGIEWERGRCGTRGTATTGNVAWGEDGSTLFIAADHSTLRLRVGSAVTAALRWRETAGRCLRSPRPAHGWSCARTSGFSSSTASRLWQSEQSWEIVSPRVVLSSSSWQRKQPGESWWPMWSG